MKKCIECSRTRNCIINKYKLADKNKYTFVFNSILYTVHFKRKYSINMHHPFENIIYKTSNLSVLVEEFNKCEYILSCFICVSMDIAIFAYLTGVNAFYITRFILKFILCFILIQFYNLFHIVLSILIL